MDRRELEQIIGDKVVSMVSLGGGCIANTSKIISAGGKMMVLKEGGKADMFLKEANGLKELQKAHVIQVPDVISARCDHLLIEFVPQGSAGIGFFEQFGRCMALLHQHTAPQFGFYEDNYIGATPQMNLSQGDELTNWTSFYYNKRLLYQYKLADRNGFVDEQFKRLFVNLEHRLPDILKGSEEPPALLHGDLWGGNFIISRDGDPVLIDPAVYYGHREAELAMTRLFGGFSPEFYKSYQATYPLKDGYAYRQPVYLLYHVLNHLNLFGEGYRSQAIGLMQKYA